MAESPATRCPRFRIAALALPAVVGLTLILSVLIYRHTPGVDGPWYAHYGFHRAAPSVFALMALCAVPLLVGNILFERTQRPAIPLLLTMLSAIGFMFTAVAHLANAFSFRPMIELTRNPMALSYFADAAALTSGPGTLTQWLSNWPQLSPEMFLHSQIKPPGPVLYFAMFIHFLGISDRAAVVADIVTACIISGSLPATYWLARAWGASVSAAFHAAVCMALFPSVILFFPSLDGIYATASCAMVALWTRAMIHDSIKTSIAFGAVLALVTFFVYNILVIGVLLALIAMLLGRRIGIIARHSLAAAATVASLYLLLWLFSGFDPIACFQSAARNQSRLLAGFDRHYPATIVFDLLDFSLGVGWLSVLLALLHLARKSTDGPPRLLVILSFIQIVVVALTGLLQAETARVWTFLTPLIAVPAGAELARQTRCQRLVTYACLFVILTLLAQNLHELHGHNAPLVGQTRPASR